MVNLKRTETPQENVQQSQISPLPVETIKRLDFTLSHLLLSPSKTVAITASGQGRLPYEYARMRSGLKVIGLDIHEKNTHRAQKFYKRDNLSFFHGETQQLVEKGITVDAILNIGSFHQLYSQTGYNSARVIERLKKQLSILPSGGQIIIQDYYLPSQYEELVYLQLPKKHQAREDFSTQSPADLLRDLSQAARPLDISGAQGFLLEEEEPSRSGTHLFRLPFKWAMEFLYRIHDLGRWSENLEKEYTIFSIDEWHKQINMLGARVTYSAPYYRDDLTTDPAYALYDEEGQEIEIPPRGFICVIEKVEASQPLYIQERRSSLGDKKKIVLKEEVDDNTGETLKTAYHEGLTDDLLPWRSDGQGNILVTVRRNVARPVVNAAPRGVPNLDGKKWAGYFVEPLPMPVQNSSEGQEKAARSVLKNLLNIDDHVVNTIRKEAQYYPKPDYLAHRLRGFTARLHVKEKVNFSTQLGSMSGELVEFYASDILKAIQVGLIPDTRLEILIMQLIRRVGFGTREEEHEALDWQKFDKPSLAIDKILNQEKFEQLQTDQEELITADHVGNAVKHVKSIFVKQGNIGGLLTGIETVEEEFFLPVKSTTNTVVCFPLSIDSVTGVKVVGVEPKKMPIPNRMDDQNVLVQLPSFQLSNEIKSIQQLRKFLAIKFDCEEENIQPMGSSFFACPEISPERVYPFTIFNPGKGAHINLKNVPLDIIKTMMNNIKPHGQSSGSVLFKGMRGLGEWYQGGVDHDLKIGANDMFDRQKPVAQAPIKPKSEKNYEPK